MFIKEEVHKQFDKKFGRISNQVCKNLVTIYVNTTSINPR